MDAAILRAYEGITEKGRDRAQALFSLLGPVMDLPTLTAIGEMERDFLLRSWSVETLGTKLSAHGYHSLFRGALLVQGKNAIVRDRRNARGEVTGTQLKHAFIAAVSLTEEEWADRNKSDRAADRSTHPVPIPSIRPILDRAAQLLTSLDWIDRAVGVIAATGRRPVEILIRGSAVPTSPGFVEFRGQAKKRGQKMAYEIPTLLNPEACARAIEGIRVEPTIQEILKIARLKYPNSPTAAHDLADSRCNKRLNRAISRHFGDLIPPRAQDKNLTCSSLRAAYLRIAVAREVGVGGGLGEDLLLAGKWAGHLQSEDGRPLADRDLVRLATTLGYSGYRLPAREFPPAPSEIPIDLDRIPSPCPTTTTITTTTEPMPPKTTKSTRLDADIHTRLKAFADSKGLSLSGAIAVALDAIEGRDPVAAILDRLDQIESAVQSPDPTPSPRPATVPPGTSEKLKGMSNAELRRSRIPGASEELAGRVIAAAIAYNEAQGAPARRYAISGNLLRAIGLNGSVAARILAARSSEIEAHHEEMGIEGRGHGKKYHSGENLADVLKLMGIDPEA